MALDWQHRCLRVSIKQENADNADGVETVLPFKDPKCDGVNYLLLYNQTGARAFCSKSSRLAGLPSSNHVIILKGFARCRQSLCSIAFRLTEHMALMGVFLALALISLETL